MAAPGRGGGGRVPHPSGVVVYCAARQRSRTSSVKTCIIRIHDRHATGTGASSGRPGMDVYAVDGAARWGTGPTGMQCHAERLRIDDTQTSPSQRHGSMHVSKMKGWQ